MGKTTIYDYARMCKFYDDCSICPLGESTCHMLISENPDKANETILTWCKEHPVETRQDRVLKMFPKARMCNEVIDICPISFGAECSIENKCCSECKKRILACGGRRK